MSRPPIFASLAYPAALEITRTSGQLLVVDVMAQWCGPCKEMDRTTWRDAKLESWVKEHGIALQLDTDVDASARQLGVTAFPTVIAFRAGTEAARCVGYRTGPDLVDWLESVRTGESTVDRLRRTLDMERDLAGRIGLLRALLIDRRIDEGVDECVWLWEHGGERDALAPYVGWLAASHEGAKARFTAIRDAAAAKLEAAPADAAVRREWVVLNGAVGDPARTIEWFQRAKADPGATALLQGCAAELVPILLARGWWDDVLRIYPDPLAELTRAFGCVERPPMEAARESRPGEMRAAALAEFRMHASVLYGSMVAARRKDAQAFRDAALALDGSDEMRTSLVRAGNQAKWS